MEVSPGRKTKEKEQGRINEATLFFFFSFCHIIHGFVRQQKKNVSVCVVFFFFTLFFFFSGGFFD